MRKRRETKKQRLEREEREVAQADFEARHKAEREAAEKQAREWRESEREADEKALAEHEAERKKSEAERKAAAKELDDKIAQLEVELTSMEKTYLETQHLFELAQLELMAHGGLEQSGRLQEAKAIATQLHHLRMALMARSAEHGMLVEQRGKKSSWASLLDGPMMWLVAAAGGLWAYKLFAKSMEKKK